MRIRRFGFESKRLGYIVGLFGMVMIPALLFLFCLSMPVHAGGSSGVWPVQLVPDSTVTSGTDSGASVFVIDFTAKTRYTGNVMGQLTGVTLSGVSPWPPAASAGVSIYYTDLLVKPAAGASMLDLANWTLIDTPTTLLTGNTVYAFDIPFNPAAPYGGLKFVWSGASPFSYGFRYSTSGNP